MNMIMDMDMDKNCIARPVYETEKPSRIDPRNPYLADWKYEKLKEQVEEFQRNLPESMDVCVNLASFGQSVIMNVETIRYQNPDLLYFYGKVNDMDAQLIQHMTQLSFLLLAQPKSKPDEEPRRIGFAPYDE